MRLEGKSCHSDLVNEFAIQQTRFFLAINAFSFRTGFEAEHACNYKTNTPVCPFQFAYLCKDLYLHFQLFRLFYYQIYVLPFRL